MKIEQLSAIPKWEDDEYCKYGLSRNKRDCESCVYIHNGLDCRRNPIHRRGQTIVVQQEQDEQ